MTGQKFRTAGRTIFEADMVNFGCITGIMEELFTNIEYIKTTAFQGRFAPGILTYSFAEGLVIQSLKAFHKAFVAFLGLDELRLLQPVYCNDTIRVEVEVVNKRLTSREDRGIARFKHIVFNQKDEPVLQCYVDRMLKCRPV
jgi:acyl dehydratase